MPGRLIHESAGDGIEVIYLPPYSVPPCFHAVKRIRMAGFPPPKKSKLQKQMDQEAGPLSYEEIDTVNNKL
jgi:hypothetical protein